MERLEDWLYVLWGLGLILLGLRLLSGRVLVIKNYRWWKSLLGLFWFLPLAVEMGIFFLLFLPLTLSMIFLFNENSDGTIRVYNVKREWILEIVENFLQEKDIGYQMVDHSLVFSEDFTASLKITSGPDLSIKCYLGAESTFGKEDFHQLRGVVAQAFEGRYNDEISWRKGGLTEIALGLGVICWTWWKLTH